MGSRIGRTIYLLGAWCSLLVALSTVPALVAASAGDRDVFLAFVTTGALAAFIALILVLGFQGFARRRNLTNLILLPLLGFILLAFIAGLPRYFHAGDAGRLSLVLFEGMAALSTSGVSAYEPGTSGGLLAFQIWRALLSGLGAFGSVVLALTIATHMNAGGIKLHRSPVHNAAHEKGHSRLSAVARQLLPVYLALIVVMFILFLISGSPSGEALVLALGAISTAGIYPGSEMHLAGGAIQLVALLGMIVGGLNLDYLYGTTCQMHF